jgi:hypothetical protein
MPTNRPSRDDTAQRPTPHPKPHSKPHGPERWRSREISDCLELFRSCRKVHCQRAGRCRGEPVACVRAGLEQAPDSIRELARSLMSAQAEGLSVEDAFEDAVDYHENYFCWVGGLQAARRG